MIFREHRGGLEESMKTCVEVNTYNDLLQHISSILKDIYGVDTNKDTVHIVKYNEHGDIRIGWKELCIITIDNFGVIGWINGNF